MQLALHQYDLRSRKLCLISFRHFAFLTEEYRSSLFLTADEARFLRALIWLCEMHQFVEERVAGP